MVKSIHWILDRKSKLFYGAAFVWMKRLEDAEEVVAYVRENFGLHIVQLKPAAARKARGNKKWGTCKKIRMARRRKAKVEFAPLKDEEVWPREGHEERETPHCFKSELSIFCLLLSLLYLFNCISLPCWG